MKASLATAATALVLALGPAGVAAAATAQQGTWQQAAPEKQSSEPAEGAMLHEPPTQVKVTFSEPLDPSSTMMVHDECGREIDNGNVQVVGTDMTVGIAKTPAGVYTVMYTAVGFGGVTGTTDDNFSFMVHAGPACDDSSAESHHHGHGGDDGHGGHDGEHEGHGGEHSGHDGEHSGHTDHTEHGASHSEHSGTEHASHDAHSTGHTEHSAHSEHSEGHSHGHGEHHGQHAQVDQEPPPVAASTEPVPLEPNSQAVLAALLMSLGLGVLGGWYLRISGQR